MINIVKLTDIQIAIVDKITSALVDTDFKIDTSDDPLNTNGVVFSSTSITEDIIRPSFYITFNNNKTNKFNYGLKERTLEFKLFYFAKTIKNSQLELLEMQDILENLFLEEIEVTEGFNLPVADEVNIDVYNEQGYLTLDMDLYTLEELDSVKAIEDDAEYMEEMEYLQQNN
ncbi:hypothetical protein K2F43_06095 [Clostridium estertheticum]|uniref:phage tail terminator family protein n=1 Tax=Clostridium estertheticum TaxID=238834 RepID=UPI001C6E1120|nr:hypothetical protein [Clostridium estertheticum]MBW9170777.1 hypothetical protein [Clostridium estertheticum]WLC74384.1 hypothetical protein KTC99_16660 [Clostridium estertheticum]